MAKITIMIILVYIEITLIKPIIGGGYDQSLISWYELL